MSAEATPLLPPAVLVRAAREPLQRAFGALVPLQPVRWTAEGLVCAPRTAPDQAAEALGACPFPVARLHDPVAWPEPEARMVSGWYRRSPSHVPAPPGQPELIQVPGEGFGPGSHPTTTMCLAGMAHLPRLPALDAGCGSGLLAQAWAQLSGRHVLACDPDPAAVAQTRCSVAAAGLERRISVVQALVETIASDRVLGRVILANMPSAGHHALIERLTQAPPGVVASGIHRADAAPVIDAYRTLGMRVVRAARRGRWHCWTMVRQ